MLAIRHPDARAGCHKGKVLDLHLVSSKRSGTATCPAV
jgi:hypothetical protein